MNEISHAGHRKRLRNKANKNVSLLEDHEILEMLLAFVIPRKDTNPLAHMLMNTFGSLTNVLNASVEELDSISGIGDRTASFLNLLPEVLNRYKSHSKNKIIFYTERDYKHYILNLLSTKPIEEMCLFMLNSNYELINSLTVAKGKQEMVNININDLIKTILLSSPKSVIIAHNHPDGLLTPSSDDDSFTIRLMLTLKMLNIAFIDHVIVADNDIFSYKESGHLELKNPNYKF